MSKQLLGNYCKQSTYVNGNDCRHTCVLNTMLTFPEAVSFEKAGRNTAFIKKPINSFNYKEKVT